MADLANRKPNEISFEILDPATDEPVGVSVKLVSMNDPRMSVAKRRRQDAMNRLERNNRTPKAKEVEEINNDFIIAHMQGWNWHGEADFHGEKPAFSREKVLEVFAEIPWFRNQVDTKLADDKAFFGD